MKSEMNGGKRQKFAAELPDKHTQTHTNTHTHIHTRLCTQCAVIPHSKEQQSGFKGAVHLRSDFIFAVSFLVKDKESASQTYECNVVYTHTHTHTHRHLCLFAEINSASSDSRARKLNLPFCHFCGTLFNKNAVYRTFHFPLEL